MRLISWVFLLVLFSSTAMGQFFSSKSTVEKSNETIQRIERIERQTRQISTLRVEIDELKRENRQLRGDIELQNHEIESLKRKQRDLYLDIDQRLSRMQQTPVKQSAPVTRLSTPELANNSPKVSASRSVTPPRTAVADPAEEQAAYRKAYDLLRPEQRRFSEAVTAFKKFLQQYPQSKLAPNAQYWMAEASYVQQDNALALPAFKKVVEGYPESSKVSGALLKIGYILDSQGKPEEARQYLNRVINEYPSSPAAGMARQRLKKIK